MTVVATATGATGVATGIMALAVIDPSIANIALAVIAAVVAMTPVVFAFKTKALEAKLKAQNEAQNEKIKAQDIKVAEVIKTTDGMKDALVASTAKASHAEGELKGKADAQIVLDAEARGAAQAAVTHPSAGGSIVLKAIEKHTEDTAKNTSATDATVQEIKSNQ